MLIDEHGEVIEADLLRHYGVDLLDIGVTWPWARLERLLQQLPVSSAARQTIAGVDPEDAVWGLSEMLQAEVVDLTRLGMWMQADAKKRGPRPTPIDRPGHRTKRRRSDINSMTRRLLDQQERLRR